MKKHLLLQGLKDCLIYNNFIFVEEMNNGKSYMNEARKEDIMYDETIYIKDMLSHNDIVVHILSIIKEIKVDLECKYLYNIGLTGDNCIIKIIKFIEKPVVEPVKKGKPNGRNIKKK